MDLANGGGIEERTVSSAVVLARSGVFSGFQTYPKAKRCLEVATIVLTAIITNITRMTEVKPIVALRLPSSILPKIETSACSSSRASLTEPMLNTNVTMSPSVIGALNRKLHSMHRGTLSNAI